MGHSEYIQSGKSGQEKVLIVVVRLKSHRVGRLALHPLPDYYIDNWSEDEVCAEMRELVAACGGNVVESVICHIQKPTADLLIGAGKVRELIVMCAEQKIDTVIFSQDLRGSQQRNLADALKVRTIDRTQLILDIFARRATSQAGKIQVELAQLEYLLPRLVGKSPELSRLGGGIGTLGPGETKLEVDRRRIDQRITQLRRELATIVSSREVKRKKRKDHGVPTVALVGYTNAGKSTLLNRLTDAGQITHDGLFTTLDSLSRQMTLPSKQKIIVSDTVGFMRELPHHLIESFKATLEEVKEADVLIHVLDISHPHFRHLSESVLNVLHELEVHETPTITVFNKIDKLPDRAWLADVQALFPRALPLSALTGENCDALLTALNGLLGEFTAEIDTDIPADRMDLVHLAHEEGDVLSVEYQQKTIHIHARVPRALANKFLHVS